MKRKNGPRRKMVFRGRLLGLMTEKVRLPNGYVASLEVVRHPGAVLIIPFLDSNTVILLRQYRPVIRSYLYEFPAGTLEKGEKPAACARREIAEETGYTARRLKRLGVIYPVPGYSTERIEIFSARDLRKDIRKTQADEVIRPLPITKAKILRLARTGRIRDAKTLCALALCRWL